MPVIHSPELSEKESIQAKWIGTDLFFSENSYTIVRIGQGKTNMYGYLQLS